MWVTGDRTASTYEGWVRAEAWRDAATAWKKTAMSLLVDMLAGVPDDSSLLAAEMLTSGRLDLQVYENEWWCEACEADLGWPETGAEMTVSEGTRLLDMSVHRTTTVNPYARRSDTRAVNDVMRSIDVLITDDNGDVQSHVRIEIDPDRAMAARQAATTRRTALARR
jgi:hypothetical protein